MNLQFFLYMKSNIWWRCVFIFFSFRGVGKGGVKEAVEKSFDKSIESVEETARSAAEFVGEAIHKRTEKVKENAGYDKDTKDELWLKSFFSSSFRHFNQKCNAVYGNLCLYCSKVNFFFS